jgi:hypothetical protein
MGDFHGYADMNPLIGVAVNFNPKARAREDNAELHYCGDSASAGMEGGL